MLPVASFLLGVAGWSASEYLLHRFAGHGSLKRGSGALWWATPLLPFIVFHVEHVAHHRNPLYFAPSWKKAGAALLLVPAFGGLASLAVGPAGGLAFGVGYAATYLAYEVLHRRIHTHPPSNRWFAWMRRHHLHHHVAPKVNHGVTSPLWDVVFRTLVRPQPVRLPRALAPAWLVDERGDARPEYAGEYEIAGR